MAALREERHRERERREKREGDPRLPSPAPPPPPPFAQFSSIQPGFLFLAVREVTGAMGISILYWVLG